MRIIFIGGYGNTGTRIVCQLLEKKGFNMLKSKLNDMYDYLGTDFHPMIERYWKTGNVLEIVHTIQEDIKHEKGDIVLKHGHFMLIFPQLKLHFPNSTFILCIRDMIDLTLKHENIPIDEFNLRPYNHMVENETYEFMKRFRIIEHWYSLADGHYDYLVRMEDLLYFPQETMIKLFEYLGCDTSFIPNIISSISKTVGHGKFIQQVMSRYGY